MRLINVDEIYRAKFHGVAEIFPPDEQNVESYKRGWNDALDAVADDSCTLTIEPHKWIPCSERLPEKYGWYQVTLKDGRASRLYYDYKGDRWIDNVRKHMFELYDIYSKITHKRITEKNEDVYWDDWVVAWMPMPEPWRGGEDGNQTE